VAQNRKECHETSDLAVVEGSTECYHRQMWHSIPLTAFWFVYFGSLGIFFPYFSLYLRENAGLSGTQVGLVLAISPLVGMIAQPIWGQIADRTGARTRTLAFLTLGTAIGYLLLGRASGFWPIVAATAFLALVGTPIFPMMMSVSMAILSGAGRHAFGRVRVWGTIGYFVIILVFPWILQNVPSPVVQDVVAAGASQPGLGLMFPITAGLVLMAAAVGFFLPKQGAVGLRAGRGDWRELLRNRAFVRFLVFSLLAHFLMHGPMWLFPLFVRSRAGDLSTIRDMWILMLVVEIPLVWLTGSGLKRLGARGLIALGVLIGGVRWSLCAFVTDPTMLFAVQALHGATVVGLNLGSPLYLDLIAPEKLRSTAQGILSMIGSGVAGMASNFGAGWFIDRSGIDALYAISGAGLIVLGGVACWILPPARKADRSVDEIRIASDAVA
jgi:PPP family 3-phenylpropionic acid transporter